MQRTKNRRPRRTGRARGPQSRARPERRSDEVLLYGLHAVEAALANLAPRRRAVLVLSQLEELPTREVARLLGLTQATVRWHLAKARREVHSLLASGLEEKEQDR